MKSRCRKGPPAKGLKRQKGSDSEESDDEWASTNTGTQYFQCFVHHFVRCSFHGARQGREVGVRVPGVGGSGLESELKYIVCAIVFNSETASELQLQLLVR